MIPRQKLETKIKQKEQEIQSLELSIREAKAYLQALQDMSRMLPRESDGRTADQVLRPGSEMAKARDAIKAAGRPLHITEILTNIGKENNKKNRLTISGSLASYVRKGTIFNKTAPNTFGLIELNNNDELAGAFPPEDFGK